MAKERSYACTLFTQASLCIALYFSLNLGQTQIPINLHNTRHLDEVWFISVRGGYRPLQQQNHLLKQMDRVAKMYKARFIVNVSEMGEDDPLTLNASSLFESPHINWYTTAASEGWISFHEKINVTRGKTLNIVGVDTSSLREFMHMGSTRDFKSDKLISLKQTLEATTSNWLVVVGYHPIVVCEKKEAQEVNGTLHHIFVNYGVNAYFSINGCGNYTLKDGVAYIAIPPLSMPLTGGSLSQAEAVEGFLLHRVSSLHMDTYVITSAGEIVDGISIGQRGKESI